MNLETKYSAGLAIIYDEKILLLRASERKHNKSYGIPKGKLEEGETNLEAAIRETREECGVNVPIDMIGTKEYTYSFVSQQHKFKKIVTYFIVRVDDLTQIGLESTDIPSIQLQTSEVDRGSFFNYEECLNVTSKSQLSVIFNIHNKSLI
ncbi:NUDIX domain-containing protein [bacterium]|nr:NUDIX domain-containing protein [bacterium]MDB0072677.1 NUDIX domain-containing protein [bacterium]MDB4234953.1 NUDIX domain-containing protein [bacterium]MDB4351842.1 NUDIX domain-containing protein [Porticoccaceae bacterium]